MTTAQQQVTNVDAAGVSQISNISEVSPTSDSGVDTKINIEGTSCLPEELQPHTPHGPTSAPADRPPQAGPSTTTSKPTSSVFSRSEFAPVHNVPMRVIHRPLPSELDESKVEAFMREMQAGDAFTPIELAKVKAPLRSDPTGQPQVFYFAMGGCHRYEATKRLGWETIRARIIDVPASQMRVYLGAGSPF